MKLKKCKKPGCRKRSIIFQGSWLCKKHYRLSQMRITAKRYGKSVPSYEYLERLLSQLRDMKCPKCRRKMKWMARENQTLVISLQHYRDGSIGFLCRSCNTRHGLQPGDSFMSIPITHKRCPRCKAILNLNCFNRNNSTTTFDNRSAYCRPCSRALSLQWQENNREKYNARQRAYRLRRKLEGRPVGR